MVERAAHLTFSHLAVSSSISLLKSLKFGEITNLEKEETHGSHTQVLLSFKGSQHRRGLKLLRVFTSASVKTFVYFSIKNTFSYFTYSLLKLPYIHKSILHYVTLKYQFFFNCFSFFIHNNHHPLYCFSFGIHKERIKNCMQSKQCKCKFAVILQIQIFFYFALIDGNAHTPCICLRKKDLA